MSKQFWALLAVIGLAFIGVVAYNGHKNSTVKTATTAAATTNHISGTSSTGVTLVEYGDFQCPFCHQYYPVVKAVSEEYKDKISFQFRNFPITNAHPNAYSAARAAEAASKQGKYWEMYNLLYSDPNWSNWTSASNPKPLFDQYANQVGLDVAKFDTDFASSAINDAIRADMNAGSKLGVQGTPTFFINDKQVQVGNTVDAFKKVIDAEIAKQAKKTGTSASSDASMDATQPTDGSTNTPSTDASTQAAQ